MSNHLSNPNMSYVRGDTVVIDTKSGIAFQGNFSPNSSGTAHAQLARTVGIPSNRSSSDILGGSMVAGNLGYNSGTFNGVGRAADPSTFSSAYNKAIVIPVPRDFGK